jgi:hypothetical protein
MCRWGLGGVMAWNVQFVISGVMDIDGGTWDSIFTVEYDGGLWSDTELNPNYDGGYITDMAIQKDNILVATEKINYNFAGIHTNLTDLLNGIMAYWVDLDGGEVT